MAPVPDRTPCPLSGSDAFHYRGGRLHCEDVSFADLVARFGSPLHVYSRSAIASRYAAVRAAFGPEAHVCYAVKANSNLSLLRLLADFGAGFDLVSGGELQRLVAAGIDPRTAVFAGVAKERWEIELGVHHAVRAFQVESPHELALLSAAGAAAGRRVPVSLRLNPGIAVDTHAYIATARHDSKFGVDLAQAGAVVERIVADQHLQLLGYHVHLGSQLRSIAPYVAALDRVLGFLAEDPQRRTGVRHYDLGGGFGIGYGQGGALDVGALAVALRPRLAAAGLQPMLEPGRYFVGDAGALATTVLGHKQGGATTFVLVDAAMNDLIRPALYSAEHPIVPVVQTAAPPQVVDVVGPVCESGDFLARARPLPPVAAGELLAVLATGAYGASMASNYNSRRRAAEVLVDGAAVRLIRRREAFAQLWADELLDEDPR